MPLKTLYWQQGQSHLVDSWEFQFQRVGSEEWEWVIRVDPGKAGIEGRPLPFNPQDDWETSAIDERVGWARGRPTSAPATNKPNWIARDKQILTFHCYYKETVEGSQDETDRIR